MRSRGLRQAGVLGALLCVTVGAVEPSVGWAQSPSTGQAAYSSGGAWAVGGVRDAHFPDGSTRSLQVMLTVPQDTIIATPATATVDLSQPWVVFTETTLNDEQQVCGSVTNPTSLDLGTSAATTAWNGAHVEVTCPDNSGYAYYRITWQSWPTWLITNPVTTAWSGQQVNPFDTGTMHGTVDLLPAATQPTGLTICGYRPAGGSARTAEPDCWGQDNGRGVVIPTTQAITAQAVPAG